MPSVPLAKDEIKNVCGPTVYVLHVERPFKQSAHYLGCTNTLIARIAQHRAGRGARLLEVIGEYGIGFEVVRTWPGDRTLERRSSALARGAALMPDLSGTPTRAAPPIALVLTPMQPRSRQARPTLDDTKRNMLCYRPCRSAISKL